MRDILSVKTVVGMIRRRHDIWLLVRHRHTFLTFFYISKLKKSWQRSVVFENIFSFFFCSLSILLSKTLLFKEMIAGATCHTDTRVLLLVLLFEIQLQWQLHRTRPTEWTPSSSIHPKRVRKPVCKKEEGKERTKPLVIRSLTGRESSLFIFKPKSVRLARLCICLFFFSIFFSCCC